MSRKMYDLGPPIEKKTLVTTSVNERRYTDIEALAGQLSDCVYSPGLIASSRYTYSVDFCSD